jgi:hypothetical protein
MKLKMPKSDSNVFKRAKAAEAQRRAERAAKAGPRELEAMRKRSLEEIEAKAARDKRIGKSKPQPAAPAPKAPARKPMAANAPPRRHRGPLSTIDDALVSLGY